MPGHAKASCYLILKIRPGFTNRTSNGLDPSSSIRQAAEHAAGDDRRAEKIAAMTLLYIDLGVRDAADAAILECHRSAIEALQQAGFTAQQVDCLRSLAEKLLHREK